MSQRTLTALILVGLLAFGNVQAQQQVEVPQEEIAQLQAQLDALQAQVTTASLLSAVQYLGAAGFHAMDEALSEGELNPRYLDTVRNAIVVANALAWPEELQDEAANFVEAAEQLATALESEAVEDAAQVASQVHDEQHLLSQAIFARLAGEEGEHSSHAESTQTNSTEIPEDAVGFDLQLSEQGGAIGGASTFRVKKGDVVALRVESATAGSLHLHGYNSDWELSAGAAVIASFTADSTGRFPLEVHPSGNEEGVVVGYLEVHP